MRRHGPALASTLGLVAVALLVGLPGLRSGTVRGDDLAFHVYRARGVVNAFADGQRVPQLDPLMINGFGYAPNLFYGPLASDAVAALQVITTSWSSAINVFLIITMLLSGVFCSRLVAEVAGSRLAGFVAGALFITAPYHLVDAWDRQAHGETLAFVFVPLVFHGLWRIGQEPGPDRRRGVSLLTIGAAGLVLSHSLSAAMVAAAVAAYVLINLRRYLRRPPLLSLLAAAGLSVALCGFFLFPMIMASRALPYAAYDPASAFATRYLANIQTNALRPARLLGLGDSAIQVGWPLIMAAVLGLLALRVVDRERRRLLLQLLAIALVAAIGATRLVPWDHLPHALAFIAFPWRLLLLVDFLLAVVGGLAVAALADRLLRRGQPAARAHGEVAIAALVAVLAVASNGPLLADLMTRPVWHDRFDYSLASNGRTAGASLGEYLPAHLADPSGRALAVAGRGDQLRVVAGAATISGQPAPSTSHLRFRVDDDIGTASGATIELPRIYYPGYRATLDGDGLDGDGLEVVPSSSGFVAIVLPPGATGEVTVSFGATRATVAGLTTTVLALLVLASLRPFDRLRARAPWVRAHGAAPARGG